MSLFNKRQILYIKLILKAIEEEKEEKKAAIKLKYKKKK